MLILSVEMMWAHVLPIIIFKEIHWRGFKKYVLVIIKIIIEIVTKYKKKTHLKYTMKEMLTKNK